MNVYLKFIRLFLVLMIGVFFLVGCSPDGGDKNTDSPSHNETSNGLNSSDDEENNDENVNSSTNSSTSDTNIISNSRVENVELVAETELKLKLNVPFEIGYSKIKEKGQHSYRERIYNDDKLLTYLPTYGFLGNDSVTVTLYKKNNSDITIDITVNIHVIKPPLEENQDYTISYFCNDYKLGYAKNFDIGFYDDGLNLVDRLNRGGPLF